MHKIVPIVIPVLKNYEGFTHLMKSLKLQPIAPVVIPNYLINLSVAESWNVGMKDCWFEGYDKCIIANDDTTLISGSVLDLIDGLDKHTVFTFPKENESAFAFFGVNIKLMQKLGWFDTEFSPAYFEDNDAFYRAQLAGMKHKFIDSVQVFHKGSQTQFAPGEKQVVSHERFRELQYRYIQKWGGLPGEETYTVPFGEE